MMRFEVQMPVDLAVKKVATKVQQPNLMTAFAYVPKAKLVGLVSEEEVDVFWVRPFVGNIFRPHFKGRFLRKEDKTVLEGTFSIGVFAKGIVVLFMLALSLFEIGILSIELRQGNVQLIPLIVPPILAGLVLLMVLIARWLGESDIDHIKAAIDLTLDS